MLAVFLTALYIRTVMTRVLLENIIDASLVLSLVCFVIALVQQFFISQKGSFRADATFLNANYYAAMIEFIVLLCIYKLLERPDRNKKVFLFGVIFVNILGLYLCDCRTAFIVLGFTVPVMLILYKKYKALIVMIVICVSGIASLLLFPDLFPRGDNLNGDLSTRLSIWKTAVKGILQNPLLGQGGDTYARIFPKFGGHPAPHAHNIFLDSLLNYGIAGCFLLFMYLKENISSIHRMYTSEIDHKRFNLAFALILCVVLHGLFDATIIGLQTGSYFLVLLGMAGIHENHSATQKACMYDMHPGRERFSIIKRFLIK